MLSTLINGMILGFVSSPSCPSNAEGIRLGTRYHPGYALLVAGGAIVGDAVVLAAILLGILPLLAAFPVLNTVLYLLGSAVLLYVSWGIFREAFYPSNSWSRHQQEMTPASRLRAFWTGFAITTFNPFTLVWWVGLLAPKFENDESVLPFSVAVLAGSFLWFLLLAIVLRVGQTVLTNRLRRWILMASGLVVLGYALYFLWEGVSMIAVRG
jgi:L-lysine exporter family protein LysE/ArgO